jgi:hypothetical protein
MQARYDLLMKLAADSNSALYFSDGSQRTGASHRATFWAGYNNFSSHHPGNCGLGRADFAAGRDFAKISKEKSDAR